MDEGKETKNYEYELEESTSLTIPVDSKTAKDQWKCVSEFDENTEARITIGANY